MGGSAWRGARNTRPRAVSQSAVFPQLCADLVRFDATGGRPDQDQVGCSFARFCARPWAAVQFFGLCHGLQLPARLADESDQQVQRVVGNAPIITCVLLNFSPSLNLCARDICTRQDCLYCN